MRKIITISTAIVLLAICGTVSAISIQRHNPVKIEQKAPVVSVVAAKSPNQFTPALTTPEKTTGSTPVTVTAPLDTCDYAGADRLLDTLKQTTDSVRNTYNKGMEPYLDGTITDPQFPIDMARGYNRTVDEAYRIYRSTMINIHCPVFVSPPIHI